MEDFQHFHPSLACPPRLGPAGKRVAAQVGIRAVRRAGGQAGVYYFVIAGLRITRPRDGHLGAMRSRIQESEGDTYIGKGVIFDG